MVDISLTRLTIDDIDNILVYRHSGQRIFLGCNLKREFELNGKKLMFLSPVELLWYSTQYTVDNMSIYLMEYKDLLGLNKLIVPYIKDTPIFYTDIPQVYLNQYNEQVTQDTLNIVNQVITGIQSYLSSTYDDEALLKYSKGTYTALFGIYKKRPILQVYSSPVTANINPIGFGTSKDDSVTTVDNIAHKILMYDDIIKMRLEDFINRRPVAINSDITQEVLQGSKIILDEDFKPDFTNVINALNKISYDYGTPFSKSMTLERTQQLRSDLDLAEVEILDIFKSVGFNDSYIDYTGRTKTNYHYVTWLLKISDGLILETDHIKNNKISFTMEHLQKYIKKFTDILETSDTDAMNEAVLERIILTKHICELLLRQKKLSTALSQFKDIKEAFDRGRYDTPEVVYDINQDKEDEDIYWFHPRIRSADTSRLISYAPNIQGKMPLVKECIKAPKGYKIVSLDITAQDAYVLCYGVLKDENLNNLIKELGSPYYALLVLCGEEPTPQNKKLAKTPVLGIMNGMSLKRVMSDMVGHEVLGEKIYKYIRYHENYTKIVDEAEAERFKTNPIRSGLFGTKNIIEHDYVKESRDKGYITRKCINSKFQTTSAEILCGSLHTLLYDILNETLDGVTVNTFRPIIPIQDELIILCRDDILEKYGNNLISYYMEPYIKHWGGGMTGEVTVGQHYLHK